MTKLGYAAAAALVVLLPCEALAEVCDTLTLSDEAQDVLIGEYVTLGVLPRRTDHLGICWRDREGSWHAERLECTSGATADDSFLLDTGGGDDRVWTLLSAHLAGLEGSDFVPAGAYSGPSLPGGVPSFDTAFRCEPAVAINAWKSTFKFEMRTDLGEGADEFHGGPARDRVASNFAEQVLRWTGFPLFEFELEYRAPSDNALDKICGGEGNDTLLGDHDNNWNISHEERLDGGPGYDICDGDPFIDVAGDSIDWSDITYPTCEEASDGWATTSGLDFLNCDARADPFDLTDFEY